MRPIIYLIIIAAAGWLGYKYYMERWGGGSDAPAAEESSVESPAVTTKDSAPTAAKSSAKPIPVFKSKIVIPDGPPGEKHLAKPGVFYVLERTSIEHATGVAAVVPGEEVRLIARKGNGIMKVASTVSKYEFEMKESQLTNDLDVAQAAERKFALTHPPSPQQ